MARLCPNPLPIDAPLRWRVLLVSLAVTGAQLLASTALADDGTTRRGVKRLFATAAEVESGMVVLPAPERTPTVSRVAFHRAVFEESEGFGEAVVELSHSGGPVRLLVLGRGAVGWRVEIGGAGIWTDLDGEQDSALGRWKTRTVEASQSVIGMDEPGRVLELDLPEGVVALRLRAARAQVGRDAVIVVDDGASESLSAHLESRMVRAGSPCSILVRGIDAALAGLPAYRACVIDQAIVRWADGTVEDAAVRGTQDGATRITMNHPRGGDAVVWIEGAVLDAQGFARRRTVHYPIRVAAGGAIGGSAWMQASIRAAGPVASETDAGWIDLCVPVTGLPERAVVFAAAELWARGLHGDARCLGWIGGLAEAESLDGRAFVRLGVEAQSVALASGERLEVRAVRIHEREGFAPIDLVDSMEPEIDPSLEALLRAIPTDGKDARRDDSAWYGRPGIASVEAQRSSSFVPGVGSHALALTHGYCADSNTWPPAHFGQDAYYYLNPNQNFSHDAFALDLADRCDQFKSYGVVAHSQGGCAALHLHTFYWSGLDWAGPGRLVQTLGTPFEGTALAGNVAALGEIFGIQCGATFDMTYDGAAAWLSTIPAAARARVYTHTTTFTNVPFFYDYCNILADVLLTDPEDGVVEHSSGHIVGANDMGLRSGWCHVAGMRDPDQTLDASRNSVLNAQGAR